MAKRKSRSKKSSNKGVGCLFIIIVLIGAAIAGGGDDDKSSSSESTSSNQQIVSTSVRTQSTSIPNNPINTVMATSSLSILADNGVEFSLEQANFYASVNRLTPSNDAFIALLGTLINHSDNRQCVYASNVRLVLNNREYTPENNVMDELKTIISPQRDFTGAYDGQCLDAGVTTQTFTAFDIPLNVPEAIEFSFKDRSISVGFVFPAEIQGEFIGLISAAADATSTATGWTHTPVPSRTQTFTASATFTRTSTSQVTPSSTITDTPHPTATNTISPTPTRRLTSTISPSSTLRPQETSVPTPATNGSLIRTINPTIYYATSNGANLRACASTSCAVAGQVSAGTALVAVAIYEGQTVNSGNSEWLQINYGGGVAYVYSDIVTTQQPVINAPPSGAGNNLDATNNTSPASSNQVCNCSGNTLNCGNFNSQAAAQACHDYCMATVGRDVHGLDGNDNDGLACESLP